LRLRRAFRLLLAVVDLSGGVSPFIDLLRQRDAGEGLEQYGGND